MTRVPDVLGDGSPTAKLAYVALAVDGPLTQLELVNRLQVDRRQLQRALESLDDHDVLSTTPRVHDARQSYYDIDPE